MMLTAHGDKLTLNKLNFFSWFFSEYGWLKTATTVRKTRSFKTDNIEVLVGYIPEPFPFTSRIHNVREFLSDPPSLHFRVSHSTFQVHIKKMSIQNCLCCAAKDVKL